ncbi:MAG: AAA family ATPase, partial [Cypionkella sp.]
MRHIRVFVSSPSDVLAERLRIELVCRRLSSRLDGIEFDVYRWEEGNYFSAHETFQRQVPETVDFDLVIGIVWSRIGLPPPDSFPKMPDGRPYPSGTAFEVLTAIEHRRSGAKLPDILFFRKTAALPIEPGASQAELATEGLRALEAFLSEWFFNSSDGFKAAFQVFEGTDAFDRLVEANLYDWLREKGWLGRERRWRIGEQGSPYAGLVAFDASREAVFFGRAHEIVRCRELLDEAAKRGTAFLLIEGASGTGKSSLARAGLLPDLLRPRTGQAERRAAIFTPGDDPCLDLSVALFGALPELDQSDYPWPALLAQHLGASGGIEPVLRSLDRFAAARQTELGAEAPPTTELILLVDQFEQLFTPGTTPESRAGFRAVLDRLARSDRARVIFTLRADAGGAARALPLFPGLLNDGAALTLEAPGPAELKEIIRGPAEAAGLGFARRDGEALDERLLADAMVPDALPLLQFTLQNLYAAAPKSAGEPTEDGTYATLRFEDYDRLGGIAGAIGDVAAKAYASLAPSVQSRLPGLVRSLTAAGPGESLLLSEASYDQATRDGDGRTLADALVEARIVVRDGDALRFAHQRVLEAWLPARAAAVAGRTLIRVRDEVTSDRLRWEAERKSRRRLLTGVRLAEATAALREDADLFTPSAEFIRKSRARARFGQTVTAAAAVVFLGVAVAALSFYLQAARNAEAAQTEAQLKTEALGDVEAQKQIAVHNADEAKAQTARAEDAAKAADASAETARRERDRATAALRTATEAANTLIFDLALKFNDEGLPSSITSVILTQARKLQDSLAASFPDDPDLLRSKAAALISLSELSATQGNGAEALAESNEALAISRALVKMVPGNTTWQRDVTVSLAKIGDLKQQAGDAAGAQAAYEESLGIARALATTDPGNSTWQGDVSLSLDNIGHLKQQAGDAAGAQAAYEE